MAGESDVQIEASVLRGLGLTMSVAVEEDNHLRVGRSFISPNFADFASDVVVSAGPVTQGVHFS